MAEQQKKYEKLFNKIYGEYINVKSTESTVANYTKLATEYEEDFVGMGYETPKVVAQTAFEFIEGDKAEVLDVACGTGLVAKGLRSVGFKGPIDGIDGSAGMLSIAQKNEGLYRNLREAFVLPEEKLQYDENTYDAIVCSGGYGPGHLMPSTLKQLIRVAKPNGVIVFATRYNAQATGYVKELQHEIEKLENEKLWQKEKVFQTTYFSYDKNAGGSPLIAQIYCLKKLLGAKI